MALAMVLLAGALAYLLAFLNLFIVMKRRGKCLGNFKF